MRFIIEFDGPIIDVRSVYYRVHCEVTAELGWSNLDEPTFWRTLRTKGEDPSLLPGARPIKLKHYLARLRERLEDDDVVSQYRPHHGIDGVLEKLARAGPSCLITLGANLPARQRVLDETGLARFFVEAEKLHPDPRRRPGELKALAAGNPRTLVVGSTDSLIRASRAAELFTVAVASGSCAARRLHQAGADVVNSGLSALAESLASGGRDLIRAGLLPPPGR